MKTFKILLIVLVIVGVYLGYHRTGQIGAVPQGIYPDKSLTPGVIATSDYKKLTAFNTCGTYSACHRKTTSNMKSIVCKEYPQNCNGTQETDHFLPIALGGADDVKNLWAELEHVMINGQDWGFHTKDKLETYLVRQMKIKNITVKEAQDCILKDWVACYKRFYTPSFGSVDVIDENDI